jgi:proliferating cell nuclear antigen
MVIFKLFSSTFTEYQVKEDVEIAINLSNLKQIMRRASQNDMLTLELENNRLKIMLKGRNSRTFSIPLIVIEEKQQKIPELKFPVSIETPCQNLSDGIEDADIVSDSLAFIIEGQKLRIEAEGDLNQLKIDITEDADTKIKGEAKEKIRAKYSIDYLKKMVQASKLTDKVKIQFNNDYPLKLDFLSIDKVQMTFILAPRVEND